MHHHSAKLKLTGLKAGSEVFAWDKIAPGLFPLFRTQLCRLIRGEQRAAGGNAEEFWPSRAQVDAAEDQQCLG